MFKVWLGAIRPKTLGASLAPVILGTAMAHRLGPVQPLIFLATLFGAVFLQIGSNLSNDYFDFLKGADTVHRKGPQRMMQAGLATPKQMIFAITLVFVLAFILGLYLVAVGGKVIILIGLISIVCALAYTAGPFPLAYLGLGDFFVFIFFGPVAVCGTYYLQTGRWDVLAFVMAIPLGLLSIAILTVNNVRDFHEDLKNKKRTLVVRLGETYGKIHYTMCVGLSLALPILFWTLRIAPWPILFSLVLLFPAFFMIKTLWTTDSAQRLNRLLGETGRLLIFYSFLSSLAWLR